MFTTDSTIIDLKIKERDLYKAIFSMNFHQVATPELGVAEARFYIFFFREESKLSAFIVLFMPHSERRVYYTYSSNPFPETELPKVEDIARAFGEDMGFFLDEKSFAAASTAEKNLWIDAQPLFGFKTPEELKLAEALRKPETTAAPEGVQPPAQAGAADEVKSAIGEAPVAQPVPAAQASYQQAPGQPLTPLPSAAPVYYQPAPATQTAQPVPAPPAYYQPVVPPPIAQPAPAAPGYYQPAPAVPAAPQRAPQPISQKEIEIEPQVEAEAEEELDARQSRRKSAAAPRSPAEKMETTGAVPRTMRNPDKEEPRPQARKNPLPASKQTFKKETRGDIGVVGREMEALARLMASF